VRRYLFAGSIGRHRWVSDVEGSANADANEDANEEN